VRVDVKQSGRLVTPISIADDPAGAQSVMWDGTAEQGRVRDGTYAGVVTVTTELGTTAHSALFRVDTVAPVLRVISFRRRVVRGGDRATARLRTGGAVYSRTFKAGLFRFALPTSSGAYTITAEDAAGNVSRTLRSR